MRSIWATTCPTRDFGDESFEEDLDEEDKEDLDDEDSED